MSCTQHMVHTQGVQGAGEKTGGVHNLVFIIGLGCLKTNYLYRRNGRSNAMHITCLVIFGLLHVFNNSLILINDLIEATASLVSGTEIEMMALK